MSPSMPKPIGTFGAAVPKPQKLLKPTAPKLPTAPKMPGFVGAVRKNDQRVELRPKTKKAIDRRIAAQKKLQAYTSLTGGTLGLAALASRGRAHAIRVENPAAAQKLKDISTGLVTAGAGVGGLGAYNFASYTNAEAKREKEKLAKNMDELSKSFNLRMPHLGGVASAGERVDAAMSRVPLAPRTKATKLNPVPTGAVGMPRAGRNTRGTLNRIGNSADRFSLRNSPANHMSPSGMTSGSPRGNFSVKTPAQETEAKAKLAASPASQMSTAPARITRAATKKKQPRTGFSTVTTPKQAKKTNFGSWKPSTPKPYTVPTDNHEGALSAFRQRFADHKKGVGMTAGAAGIGAVGFYGGAHHEKNKQP